MITNNQYKVAVSEILRYTKLYSDNQKEGYLREIDRNQEVIDKFKQQKVLILDGKKVKHDRQHKHIRTS